MLNPIKSLELHNFKLKRARIKPDLDRIKCEKMNAAQCA